MTEAIESSLRELVTERLGTNAWEALLLALSRDLVEADPHDPEAYRIQCMCLLAARELDLDLTFMLHESGMKWVLKGPMSTKRPAHGFLQCLRSNSALTSIGLMISMEHAHLDPKGIVLIHLQPVTGCRAFVFGILNGLGLLCSTSIVPRLLETYELNGHADMIGVEY